MYILLTGIIINAVSVIDSMSCAEDWSEYQGKCLKHYSKPIHWSGAQDSCVVLRNAKLATVDNPETQVFVQNNITGGSDSWIGLSIPDISKSSWKWSDGNNTSSYNAWNDEIVNFACAVMKYDRSKGYWYTIRCTDMIYYVCEKEMSDDNCSDWLSFDTHCYLIITEHEATNMAASRKCWSNDSYLISINSQSEADFIYGKLEINTEYWIGLSPLQWVNDVPYQWNNWGDSGPTRDTTNGCVYMKSSSGKWFCGNCDSNRLQRGHHSYICQKDAVIDAPTTPNVAVEEDTKTTTVYSEFDELYLSTIPSSAENSKRPLLTVIVPAVCGGLVVIIVIIVVVILIRRKRRSNESGKRNPPLMNTTYVTNDIAVGSDNEGEHQDQEKYIYDEAEVVQTNNGTVVVNGDVYAIVDKDKIQNPKVQDNMVSKQHTKNNRKQEIAKGQNHIIIGADVYAIVNKNKPDSQQKPKQKKKKPPTPPKLEDNSGEIHSNGLSHVVVGTDVYAVVDKEKVKPNKQQTTQQKKKKPPTPPKLEDKTEDINTNGQSNVVVGTDVYAVVDKEKVKPNKQQKPQQKKKKQPAPPKLVDKADDGSVYYDPDMNAVPDTPTKHKTKGKTKTEDTGVVYADLDLTEYGSGNGQDRINDEHSGVVYADVRG